MSEADKGAVLAALAKFPGYRSPTVAALRRASGVPSAALAAAVQSLRYAGKMEWDRLRLSPSLRAELDARTDEARAAGEAETAAQAARREACEAGAARAAASRFGGVFQGGALRDGPAAQRDLGSRVQALALADDPAQAAAMVRRMWAPLWQKICAQAEAAGERPVAVLIAALERGL